MADPLTCELEVPLRWRDIDTLGHLNQSVYHELLEEARAGLLMRFVERVGADRFRGGLVVRHVDLDYLHEVRRDDGHVVATAAVTRAGRSSIHIAHEVRLPDGTVAATGGAVLVGWDPEARGKRELTDVEREALGVD